MANEEEILHPPKPMREKMVNNIFKKCGCHKCHKLTPLLQNILQNTF